MRKLTLEEIEELDAKSDIWIEDERIRQYLESQENVSNNPDESL
jgi:hypothetical protein